ncbi:MAG: dihydrodipicolinate synthase family protein [Verrucomicrobiota bacterium]
MNSKTKLGGAVVPLVTPATAEGQIDFAAVDRLVESQIAGGVEGLLILGTTGEGPCVPQSLRSPLIEHAVRTARKRILIYANVAENSLTDAIASMKDFFAAGADVVAALPPFYFAPRPIELVAWYRALLDAAPGPMFIYNIPLTTHVSIPLDVIGELIDHPRVAGIKDSENDPARHEELLSRFGGRDDFSIFIGVGPLMARGLKQGADGIVPSSGNVIPKDCQQQVEAARRQDWRAVDVSAARQAEVTAVYQKDRTLAQSLAALKGMLHHRGICEPHVFRPLLPMSAKELESLRVDMGKVDLFEGLQMREAS